MSATKVNLELQMKFLDQLHAAVSDALDRFADQNDDKLAELEYIDREVKRARRIVSTRMESDDNTRPRAQDMPSQQIAV